MLPTASLVFSQNYINGTILVLKADPCVRKQPILALYFEFENKLKFYTFEARVKVRHCLAMVDICAKPYEQMMWKLHYGNDMTLTCDLGHMNLHHILDQLS